MAAAGLTTYSSYITARGQLAIYRSAGERERDGKDEQTYAD